MREFWQLASTFIQGCAQVFYLPVPGLGLSFFQLFVGVMIIDVIVSSVYIILGVHTDDTGITISKEYGMKTPRFSAKRSNSHKSKTS